MISTKAKPDWQHLIGPLIFIGTFPFRGPPTRSDRLRDAIPESRFGNCRRRVVIPWEVGPTYCEASLQSMSPTPVLLCRMQRQVMTPESQSVALSTNDRRNRGGCKLLINQFGEFLAGREFLDFLSRYDDPMFSPASRPSWTITNSATPRVARPSRQAWKNYTGFARLECGIGIGLAPHSPAGPEPTTRPRSASSVPPRQSRRARAPSPRRSAYRFSSTMRQPAALGPRPLAWFRLARLRPRSGHSV